MFNDVMPTPISHLMAVTGMDALRENASALRDSHTKVALCTILAVMRENWCLTAANMSMLVSWVVTPCRLLSG
jgi:hypothetical protein